MSVKYKPCTGILICWMQNNHCTWIATYMCNFMVNFSYIDTQHPPFSKCPKLGILKSASFSRIPISRFYLCKRLVIWRNTNYLGWKGAKNFAMFAHEFDISFSLSTISAIKTLHTNFRVWKVIFRLRSHTKEILLANINFRSRINKTIIILHNNVFAIIRMAEDG